MSIRGFFSSTEKKEKKQKEMMEEFEEQLELRKLDSNANDCATG